MIVYHHTSSPSPSMPRIFLSLLHHCAGAAFGENVILMSGGQDTTVQARGLLPAPKQIDWMIIKIYLWYQKSLSAQLHSRGSSLFNRFWTNPSGKIHLSLPLWLPWQEMSRSTAWAGCKHAPCWPNNTSSILSRACWLWVTSCMVHVGWTVLKTSVQ